MLKKMDFRRVCFRLSVGQDERKKRAQKKNKRERDWAGVRIFFRASSAALSPVLAHFSCHPVVFGSFRLNEGLGKASL